MRKPTSRVHRLAIAIFVFPLILAAKADAQTPVVIAPSPTSFLCYSARQPRGTERFKRVRDFWIKDRLRRTFVDVVGPETVCNATDSGGAFADEHLGGYRVRRAGGVPRYSAKFALAVDNALGRTVAAPIDRDGVLVPTATNLGSPATPLDPLNQGDAYSCYRVRGSRNLTQLPRGLQVSLTDPFSNAAVYDVVRPTRLCYAATAEQPPASDPAARLLCYSIRRARGQALGTSIASIHVDDRFGARTLETTGRARRRAELCLPSTIPDADADGLTDEEEALRGTNPVDADSDGDGVPDGYEVEHGFDPLDASDGAADTDADGLDTAAEVAQGSDPRNRDSDGDGLTDGAEVNTHLTSPLLADTDGDGIADGAEIANGLDPLDPADAVLDPDSDGLNNLGEVNAGTDINNPDTDADGLLDGAEVNSHGTDPLGNDTDDDGLMDGDEVDVYGTNPLAIDTDSGGRDDFAEVTLDGTDALNAADDVQALPPLLSTVPSNFSSSVARTAWTRLTFSRPVRPALLGSFTFTCGGNPQAATFHLVADTSVVVNPTPELPTSVGCVLAWPGYTGPASLNFSTAGVGSAAFVKYDRDDPRPLHPFPDDFWLTLDPTTATGWRVNAPVPTGPVDLQTLFRVVLEVPNAQDGFSSIAPLIVETSLRPLLSTLPTTAAASLDPIATVGLFDLDPASSEYGKRIPFELRLRTDSTSFGLLSHSLIIFPSIPLEPGRTYALVVTRRALVSSTRPLDPSPFFQAALAPPVGGESSNITAVRALADDVLDVLTNQANPPIPSEDIALATRFTIRSMDGIADDLRAMKAQVLALPPAEMKIKSVKSPTDPSVPNNLFYPEDVGAVVYGEWKAPNWRNADFLARDASGSPVITGSSDVEFVLLLPKQASTEPVPLIMYQHGNPGSAQDEVPFFGSWKSNNAPSLAQAGFALIGFTDNINREVSGHLTDQTAVIEAQVTRIFNGLLGRRDAPDFWVQTNAEQLAFIRALRNLRTLDVLPLGAPDGVPDLDLTQPLGYFGLSSGAFHGAALLPYVPEVRAAALTVGGAPFVENLVHQRPETFITGVGSFFSSATPAEIWTAVALFQGVFDRQDGHNHARFMYREPFPVGGSLAKPSTLLTEGLNDSLVPNNGTEALAWMLGPMPLLLPEQRVVPFLEKANGPVTANINATTTAGISQYVPAFVPGIPATLGCEFQSEGHYCPQTSPPGLQQRADFFRSALTGAAPTVTNALAVP